MKITTGSSQVRFPGKKRFRLNGTELFLIVLALLVMYPLFLVLINSFKTYAEVMSDVVALPRQGLHWDNYLKVIKLMDYPQLFLNTLLITGLGVAGVVLFSAMAGYKLSRTKTRYSWVVFLLCAGAIIIPFQTIMITLVKVAKILGLLNSLHGTAIIYWGLACPFAIFLYHGFVKTIPVELEECAILDGCSEFRVFFQIIFPLLTPVTVTIIIMDTMWFWNDFLFPLLVLGSNSEQGTLQLAAYQFFGMYKSEWHLAMASVILIITPVVLLFVILQKYIIKGMVAGAIKG
ncbi:MAG TPA: carbohydrate ABC transporter permease [Bacillota bacterium]|nr:carbohydrate ABC transporter permease [Bacillota bacterium]